MPEFDPDFSTIDGDFRVGAFHVRPLLKIIRPLEGEGGDGGDGDDEAESRRLPDKAMAVLLLLAENHREVCERDFLLDEVWGRERESYDRVLDNAIRDVRRAFGDDARNPKYIQTIAKTGYRLIADVDMAAWNRGVEEGTEENPEEGTEKPVTRGGGPSDETTPKAPSPEGASPEGASPEGASPEGASPPGQAEALGAATPVAREPWSGRGWRLPALVGLLLLVAVVIMVAVAGSPFSNGDLVTVRLERDAAGVENRLGDPWHGDFERLLARNLGADHPCDSSHSLLAYGASWLQPEADVSVRVRQRSGGAGAELEAVIDFSPSETLGEAMPKKVIIGRMQSEAISASLARLADKIAGRIDAAICDAPGIPDDSRSCHCISSFRSWYFPEDPDPYLEHLETGVRLDPDNFSALDSLVEVYLWAGYRERAEEKISRGLQRVQDPGSTEALALLRRLAQVHRDHSEEGRLLQLLLEREPDATRWRLGQVFYLLHHAQDCAGAMAELESLVDASPKRDDLLGIHAEAMHFCGESEKALMKLKETLRASPDLMANQIRYVNLANFLGHYDEARNQIKEALAVVPESSEIRMLLGRIETAAGAHRSADLWYERALEVTTVPREAAMAQSQRAKNALLSGDPERALELLETVDRSVLLWDLFPSYVQARAHLELGEVERARAVVARMAALESPRRSRFQDHFLYEAQARLLHAEGHDDVALRKIDDALDGVPFDRSDVLLAKAEIAQRAGRHEIAEEALDRLLDLNPHHGPGLCLAGAVYQETGRRDLAVEYYRRGLENFEEPETSLHAGRCIEGLDTSSP